MSKKESLDIPHWYAIHTKPKQENRANENLIAWSVETFAPRLRRRHFRQFVVGAGYSIEPLFRSYIFARFNVCDMLHKVRFTRGVHSVVSCGGGPAPIDDEIIRLIQSRVEDGVVRLDDELKPGDKVVIGGGPLKGLSGIFDRRTSDSERVLLLLRTVAYQACVEVESVLVRKAG